MQQVAVRWQSKTFCKNNPCRAGTTKGLLIPARESRLAVCIYLVCDYTFGAVIAHKKSENNQYSQRTNYHHSCMSSPLVPDPIRVQPCVWCLF